MKVALCFLISYDNNLVKEDVWREWIDENKSLFNIYIHYNPKLPITSDWVKDHVIPEHNLQKTSYFHVIPAYLSLLGYAQMHDTENKWFCMLTESCVPVVSPHKFRYMAWKSQEKSVMAWRKAWWNPHLVKRANLRFFTEDMQLGHDPWFILTNDDVKKTLNYPAYNHRNYKLICDGGLANESLFAMIFHQHKTLSNIINTSTHITDWTKPSSSTSPYVFKNGSSKELSFISESITQNKYAFFMRKVNKSFPDDAIRKIIQENIISDSFWEIVKQWICVYSLDALKIAIIIIFASYQYSYLTS